MGKQLTDDYLKWVLDIDGKPAQKSLNDLSTKTAELRNSNKSLNAEMEKLRARGKENTAEFKKLDAQFKENNNTIKQAETKMAALRKEIGLNGLSQKELTKYLKETKRAWELATPGTDEYKKLDKELKAITARQSELRGSTDKTNGTFGALKTSTIAIYSGIIAVAGAFGGLIRSVISTYGEFEKFRSVLTNAYGSAEVASEKMSMLQGVASELPVSLREATESFIKMKNSGMEPTREMMITLTDVAASQGKSLDQYVEALKDAKMFEWERLKEFGVKAQVAGDNVTFTFRGQQTVVKKSSEAVEQYLINLGKMPGIAGSSAAVMNTLEGKISNLGDSWDRMLVAMGDGGFGAAAKKVIGLIGGIVDGFAAMISKPVSAKMEEDRVSANALAIQLMDTNLKADDRNRIYGELQKIAPEIIKGISAENIETGKLKENLRKYNEEMVNKIILQQKQEEIDAQAKVTAEQRLAYINAQTTLSKQLIDVQKAVQFQDADAGAKAQSILEQNMSLGAKAQALQKLMQEQGFKMVDVYSNQQTDLGKLNVALSDYYTYAKYANKEELVGIKLQEEKMQLMKQLGVSEASPVDPNPGKKTDTGLTDAQKKEAEKEAERLKKLSDARAKYYTDITSFDNAYYSSKLSKDEQEIAAINSKYEVEKQKAKDAKDADIITEQQKLERIAQLDEMNAQEIVAKRQEFADRDFDKQIADQEAFEKRKKEIREQYISEGADALKARELAVIEDLHKQGIMDEETYQQAKNDIINKYNELQKESDRATREEMVQGYIETLADIENKVSILSNTASNFKQAETIQLDTENKKQQKSLDDKYKREIKSAGNDAAKKKQIDEQYNREKEIMANDYEAKKAAIQKKWAGKELLLRLAEIMTNTGVGIMKTYAEFGYPLGIPMTVLLAAQGASQLALAKAQYDQAMSGFSEGGWTGPGNKYEVKGFVHADEDVVPQHVVHHPVYQQIARPIIYSLMANKQGFAEGLINQSINTNASNGQVIVGSDPDMKLLLQANLSLMQKLNDNGIDARMIYGHRDIETWNKAQDDLSFIKSKAK